MFHPIRVSINARIDEAEVPESEENAQGQAEATTENQTGSEASESQSVLEPTSAASGTATTQ